jgi:hypothetical protein
MALRPRRTIAIARAVLIGAALASTATVAVTAQPSPRRPAVAVDPIAAILEAFQSHRIVALGEGPHGNEQGLAFRLALIRDPRFTTIVNDIVVESGSAPYQDAMDRFLRGELPDTVLRDVQENSAVATPVWDRQMYGDFFRAIRALNETRPPERRLRIVLGDPPIDWSSIKTVDDYRPILLQRDSHPAEVIRREVIAKGRRALVIYGDGHLLARSERPAQSLTGILEAGGTKVFNVTSTFANVSQFQADASSWRAPTLTRLEGTPLGAIPYDFLLGSALPVDFYRDHPRIEEHYDALLYLGPRSSMRLGRYSYPRCAEPDYVKMRVARMVATGMPPTVVDRLTTECNAARR